LSGSENKTTQSTPLPTWHSILNREVASDTGRLRFRIVLYLFSIYGALDFGRVLLFRVESFKTSRVTRNQCGRRRRRWDMGEYIYDIWDVACALLVFSSRTPSANSRSQPAETTQVRFTPFAALIYLFAESQQRTHTCLYNFIISQQRPVDRLLICEL
jgi:hypothetical protein